MALSHYEFCTSTSTADGLQKIGPTRPFPSGTGIANLHYPTHRAGISTSIKTAIPLLDAIDIQDKDITADALLTQRHIAHYLVEQRNAHYHFTVKNNQPGLFQDIALFFDGRQSPDFVLTDTPDHGRIEVRKIWTTTALNDYLNFPQLGQAFVIQREGTQKKTGLYSSDIAYSITSRSPEQADSQRLLATNRGHWCIENSCHYILDWN